MFNDDIFIQDQLNKTLTGHGKGVRSVSFSNQGLLASGSWDNSVKIWNVTTGESIKELSGPRSYAMSFSFSSQDMLQVRLKVKILHKEFYKFDY